MASDGIGEQPRDNSNFSLSYICRSERDVLVKIGNEEEETGDIIRVHAGEVEKEKGKQVRERDVGLIVRSETAKETAMRGGRGDAVGTHITDGVILRC